MSMNPATLQNAGNPMAMVPAGQMVPSMSNPGMAQMMPGMYGMMGGMPGTMPGTMPGNMMQGNVPGAMPGAMPGNMAGNMMQGNGPGAMPGQVPGAGQESEQAPSTQDKRKRRRKPTDDTKAKEDAGNVIYATTWGQVVDYILKDLLVTSGGYYANRSYLDQQDTATLQAMAFAYWGKTGNTRLTPAETLVCMKCRAHGHGLFPQAQAEPYTRS